MHTFTSEEASGKCIWSTCIISKLVLINSGENVVHGPGAIETIALTALASQETQWTSESVFPRGHADSYFIFICKAKASYSTWTIASGSQLREIPQDCCVPRKTQQFPRTTAFCLSFPVWMVSVHNGTLSLSQAVLYLRAVLCWKGCHCSPGSFGAGCCSWRPELVQLMQRVHRLQTLLFLFILLLRS